MSVTAAQERDLVSFDMADVKIVVHHAVVVKDVAAVVLTATVGGATFLTEGSSRRFLGDELLPADRPDPELAINLAFSRALGSLQTKIDRQVTGRIKHNDDTRDQQRELKIQRAKDAKKAAKKATTKKKTHGPGI